MAENRETFEIEIISPDEVLYRGPVAFAEFTTVIGEMGVYKNHIPLTTILEPCVMALHNEEGIKKCAVLGGFVEIQKEKITVMAEDAQWPDEIDVERAKAAAKRAEERIQAKTGDTDVRRAEVALKKALARVNTAG
ncbi:MAG: ATP synthase F1 subunit epsilon [Eubacteriales bacterium]